MATIRIPLGSRKYPGLIALIDDVDLPLVEPYSWSPYATCRYTGKPRYARAAIGGKSVMLHRHLMGNPDCMVDHVNRNGFDCRRSNLRLADGTLNRANSKMQSNNKSGIKGVSWNSQQKKWNATIKVRGHKFNLGFFRNIEDAAAAYAKAAEEYFGEFARAV